MSLKKRLKAGPITSQPGLPIVRGDVEEHLGSLVGFTIRRLSRRRASSNRLPVGQLQKFQGPAIHRRKVGNPHTLIDWSWVIINSLEYQWVPGCLGFRKTKNSNWSQPIESLYTTVIKLVDKFDRDSPMDCGIPNILVSIIPAYNYQPPGFLNTAQLRVE